MNACSVKIAYPERCRNMNGIKGISPTRLNAVNVAIAASNGCFLFSINPNSSHHCI